MLFEDIMKHRTILAYTKEGDHVVCCNCEKEMIVPYGTEYCPQCENSSLAWVDPDGYQEFNEGNPLYHTANLQMI